MEMTDARGHPPVVSWLLSERDASETEPVLLFLGGGGVPRSRFLWRLQDVTLKATGGE